MVCRLPHSRTPGTQRVLFLQPFSYWADSLLSAQRPKLPPSPPSSHASPWPLWWRPLFQLCAVCSAWAKLGHTLPPPRCAGSAPLQDLHVHAQASTAATRRVTSSCCSRRAPVYCSGCQGTSKSKMSGGWRRRSGASTGSSSQRAAPRYERPVTDPPVTTHFAASFACLVERQPQGAPSLTSTDPTLLERDYCCQTISWTSGNFAFSRANHVPSTHTSGPTSSRILAHRTPLSLTISVHG
mmetsp:Transcript_29172/g.89369  ORF Transcript_29172/g.89369 Transcript_29172/m.89369 type:complete len:240 (+) Transcript_29172:571-1290(+)